MQVQWPLMIDARSCLGDAARDTWIAVVSVFASAAAVVAWTRRRRTPTDR